MTFPVPLVLLRFEGAEEVTLMMPYESVFPFDFLLQAHCF
jgi:hypothetical protein